MSVAAAAGASPSVTGRVVRVIDGDTIWVKVAADSMTARANNNFTVLVSV